MTDKEIQEVSEIRNHICDWLNQGSVIFSKMALTQLDDYLVKKIEENHPEQIGIDKTSYIKI